MTVARYYQPFLDNSLIGKIFAITLTSGAVLIGAPSVGSILNPFDPNAEFSLKIAGQTQRIRFNDVRDAHPMVACRVRTVGPHTNSGSDFDLHVPEASCDEAIGSDGSVSLLGVALPPTKYAAGQVPSPYKFVTIKGSDFKVTQVTEGANGSLRIEVERSDEADSRP